jgi:hypothetical protein
MRQARNVVEWVTNPEFLGLEHLLWPAQTNALVDMFQEECWNCSERLAQQYIHDHSYGNIDSVVLLEHGECPVCGRRKSVVHPTPVREYVGCWGQRTGKSWLTAVAATYQLHRALCKGNLAKYYDLPDHTRFEFAFVDPSKKYAWPIFGEMWSESPWQRELTESLSLEVQKTEGTGFYFPEHHIEVVARSSDASNCRGGTRLFATIDEYDWARHYTKRRGFDPSEMRKVLLNSFVTVESCLSHLDDPDPLVPKLVLISSPNFDSKNLALLVRKQSHKRISSNLSTWCVNPNETKETLITECGGENTLNFRRDFAAEIPSLLKQ